MTPAHDPHAPAGLAMIVVGLVTPVIIDAVETARQLDISRDVGVVPWLVLTVLGVAATGRSFVRR